MKIAAYCRVSTDKADQLNSLEAQKEFFSEYTQRTGDVLIKLYADEGISGTKIKNRKEFLRMMSDAEKGMFDAIFVVNRDRLFRGRWTEAPMFPVPIIVADEVRMKRKEEHLH